MNICYVLGKKIKEIRNLKGISQEVLAEKTGLHRTYISSVERGNRNISLINIEKIALALDIEIFELFI